MCMSCDCRSSTLGDIRWSVKHVLSIIRSGRLCKALVTESCTASQVSEGLLLMALLASMRMQRNILDVRIADCALRAQNLFASRSGGVWFSPVCRSRHKGRLRRCHPGTCLRLHRVQHHLAPSQGSTNI